MVTLTAIIFATGFTSKAVFAGSPAQNYSVGFTDGCDDGKTGTSTAYYGHSNGTHHSDDYNNGYNAGYTQCSTGTQNQNSNNVDQNNRNQAQSQGSVQHTFCVNVFGSCPSTTGQSQGLEN